MVEGLHMMLRTQSHVGVFTGEGGELLASALIRAACLDSDSLRPCGLPERLLKDLQGE